MSEHDKPQDNARDTSKIASLLDDHDPAISALYRQSAQELPPAALDARILQAAHAAVSEQETPTVQAKPSQQWRILGGLAASIVVALLAVELLPHALRTPTPSTRSAPAPTPLPKERAASESISGAAESARPAQEPAAPPSITNDQPMSTQPAAPLGQGLLQERAESNSGPDRASKLTDEPAGKAESEPAATTQDDAATFSGAAGTATEATQTESTVIAPESPSAEFDRIAALWKDGDAQEAIDAFATFRKRYPDFTPDAEHLELFKALQAELEARERPQTDAGPGK